MGVVGDAFGFAESAAFPCTVDALVFGGPFEPYFGFGLASEKRELGKHASESHDKCEQEPREAGTGASIAVRSLFVRISKITLPGHQIDACCHRTCSPMCKRLLFDAFR